MPRDAYFDRIETLAGFVQSAQQISSSFQPNVPGDRRWSIYDKHAAEGLELDERTYDALCAVGRTLGVPAPW